MSPPLHKGEHVSDPMTEAETIVRNAQRRHWRKRGAIAGVAVALSVATGPLWAQPSSGAAACGTVFAGRAGTINTCTTPENSKTDDTIEKIIGTTTTGCVVGFVFGLGAGLLPGCVGGAVGNIAW